MQAIIRTELTFCFTQDKEIEMSGVAGSQKRLTTSELARMCGVDRQTVIAWEKEGRIPRAPRTLGGHRRFGPAEIEAIRGLRGIIDDPVETARSAA